MSIEQARFEMDADDFEAFVHNLEAHREEEMD